VTFQVRSLMTPDGRQLRAAVWPLQDASQRRAVCVLLNGHTEFLEKYQEVAEELSRRGFDVVSLDWRGQGASERRVRGNRAGHVGSFDEYLFDLATVLLQVVEPMRREHHHLPIIGLGHSMGGHVLLRFIHDHPRRFQCGVVVAPMLEINLGTYSPSVVHLITRLHNIRRPSTRFVYGVEGRDPLDLTFEQNAVTSDRGRFERNQAFLKAQQFLRINGPTFGWLAAAFRSMRRMRKRSYAQDITTPLLLIGAGRDRVVHTKAIRDFAARLPEGRYVEIEDAEHEILQETDTIRTRFWREFDAFVKPYIPSS
jgi:lysophospholipase